jgi:hypothetical protein
LEVTVSMRSGVQWRDSRCTATVDINHNNIQ